ncbi:hypothetical protein I317_04647 [Kwoniella heveanensis CBS 569]|nr:hypothetical protein I317_04647 [Kwoniella heveanensis CBS 569]
MPRDLGERAQGFRERWLAPSGGWLAELVILISDLTGIWDIVILSGVFVCAWIVIRTSPMEIALILGLGFDVTIPLQYQNDDKLSSIHADHLANYWPVLMIGCLCEVASFFLLHPDLFTLIVCIKTTFMLMAWLSRDQEGLPIVKRRSSRLADYDGVIGDAVGGISDRLRGVGGGGGERGHRGGDRGSSAKRSSGRSGEPDSKPRDRSEKKHRSSGKSTPTSDSSDVSTPTSPSSAEDPKSSKPKLKSEPKEGRSKPSSFSSSSSSNGPRNMPKSKNVSFPYKHLHKAGYTDPAIAGMILAMNKADKDRARKNMKTWCKEKDKANIVRRNKQYAEQAEREGWPEKFDKNGNPLPRQKPGVGAGAEAGAKAKPIDGAGGRSDPKKKMNKLAIPVESVRKVEALLRKSNLESVDRKKILKILKDPKDKEQIAAVAKQLQKIGINVYGPEFKEGYGESDGKGGFRDIVLQKDTVDALNKGMAKKKFDKPTHEQWLKYIQQPRSRKEIESKIMPLCKRVDVYLGDGYIGGGRHKLDPKSIQSVKAALMKRTGVSTEMADQMLLKAMNEPTVEAVNKMIQRWQQRGLPKEEYEALRKSMPDWA